MDLVEIGQRVESERQRLGLTAVEVYDDPRIKIAQTTYKNYEIGKRDMPSSLIIKLWNIGFDVMYVLTGQRLEDLAGDMSNGVAGEQTLPLYHQRLVMLPEIVDTNNPADALLVAMYHAEEALVQAGAEAHSDYNYKDLATIGLGLIDIVK